MKINKRLATGLLAVLLILPDIAYASNILPNRDGSINWYNWRHLQTFQGQPLVAPNTTGFHSMSMFANIDYKQDMEKFQSVTTQYPTDGRIEWFHQVSEFVPVHYDTGAEGYMRPPIVPSGVNAYDYEQDQIISKFDISLGQWMIRNSVLSRPNEVIEVVKEDFGNQVKISPLSTSPFGVQNALDLAERDEFVINMSKAAFGPIESRPVLFEIDSWRYSRAILWHQIGTWYDGICDMCIETGTPRGWKWSGEWDIWEEHDPNPELTRAQSRPEELMEISLKENNHNTFYHQRVSKVGAGSWGNNDEEGWTRGSGELFTPVCGFIAPGLYPAIGFIDYREEFVTNPESHVAPVINIYNRDYWTYTSSNVWELYIYDLISRGILDQNELFYETNKDRPKPLIKTGSETDDFRMINKLFKDYAKEFEDIISAWGRTLDGQLQFPVMAPELGIVLPNNQYNSTSINIGAYAQKGHVRDNDGKITLNKNPELKDVLGRNYIVTDNTVEWNTSQTPHREKMGLPGENLFENENMTVIAALKLIERVLRVNDHNMSKKEASIISYRYGARFLDTVAEDDRATVEYLIAMGILDFEDFGEYSNLYNMLTREFSFVLLGRLANPSYRSQFSKILLTDAEGFTPSGERNYQTYIRSSKEDISRFINNNGDLVHNPTVQEAEYYTDAFGRDHLLVSRTRDDEFNLLSDTYVVRVQEPAGTNEHKAENVEGSFKVTLNIDDPLKYLFLGMPLVLTSYNHKLSPYSATYHTPTEGSQNYKPLYIVTDQSVLDLRNDLFKDDESIVNNFRPYPENRLRGQHPAWLSKLDELIIKSKELRKGNPSGDFSSDPNWMSGVDSDDGGIADQWFNPLPGSDSISQGILGVALLENGRYIIEFIVPAPTAEVAVTFVMNNMTNRTHAMFAESEVSGVITPNGQPLVQEGTSLTDGIISGGDISHRGTDAIVIGNGVSLEGGNITKGDFAVSSGEISYLPYEYAIGGGTNSGQDTLGKKPLLSTSNNQLNSSNTTIKSVGGLKDIRSREWFDMPFINVSVSGISEFFTSEFEFDREITVFSGRPDDDTRPSYETDLSKISGQIFIEFVPYIPSRSEQASILDNQIDLSDHDWFFTKPDNAGLLEYWDYNIAVTDAIFKTFGVPENTISSGYYSPKITILIPELEDNLTLTNNFRRQFLDSVGSNLDPMWVKKWIDEPGEFNKPAIDLNKITTSGVDSEGKPNQKRDDETRKTLWIPSWSRNPFIKDEMPILSRPVVDASGYTQEEFMSSPEQEPKTSTLQKFSGVKFDVPFWAEIYFFNRRLATPSSVLESRITEPEVNVYLIHEHVGPNRVFGSTEDLDLDEGGGLQKIFNPRYILNGFDQIYVSQNLTNYSYVNGSYFSTRGLDIKDTGKKILVNNVPFIVVGHTTSEYLLVSDHVIHGKIGDDGSITTITPSDSGFPLNTAYQTWIGNQLGNLSNSTANTDLTYDFEPFNTFHTDLSFASVNEVFVENGELKPFIISVDEITGSIIRTPMSSTVGSEVVFRPYVRLSTSDWLINSNNTVTWSPKLNTNIGTSAVSNMVNRVSDSILSATSENRLLLSELRQKNVDIGGGSMIHVDNDGVVSLRVPYNEEFFRSDKTLDVNAVYTHLDKNGLSTQVTADGNTYPVSSYLNIKGIGAHDVKSTRYTEKTLVQINNVYYTATPEGIEPWEKVSWLSYVDFELERFQDFSVVEVIGMLGADNYTRSDSFQVVRPLRPSIGARTYNLSPSLTSLLGTLDKQVTVFEGVSLAEEFFNQISNNFRYMRTRSLIGSIIGISVYISVLLAVSILLSRVGRETPWTFNMVAAFHSNTSVDLFAVMSLGVVRVDDVPKTWLETMTIVIAVGVLPMTIVMLFMAFGLSIL